MGWGLAAAAIGSSLVGAFGAKQAVNATREAAYEQADLTYAQRQEEIRRLAMEQDYSEGLIRARAATAGVENAGTPQVYQQFVSRENYKRRRYAYDTADKERKAIRAGAPGSGAGNLAAASELLSGITSAIGKMG